MSIKVSSVTKRFGQQKALDNVSFEINDNQIVGFLGPNGAGKSTMMKIITGYMQADSGIVEINGRKIDEQLLETRRTIGYLPEHNPLYLDMYVREYLEMVAGIYKMDNKARRIDTIIETTGLQEERHKKIASLSKGYRQRVGLAQALLPDPSVLILDEPTTGLDPNQIMEIRDLIREIGKKKTVMLSTHIMQEVEAVCQNVIIIDHGVIKANGSTQNITTTLAGHSVIEVSYNINPPIDSLSKYLPHAANISEQDGVLSITVPDNEEIRPLLFNYAVENKLTIFHLQKRANHIEDVFHTLTEHKHSL